MWTNVDPVKTRKYTARQHTLCVHKITKGTYSQLRADISAVTIAKAGWKPTQRFNIATAEGRVGLVPSSVGLFSVKPYNGTMAKIYNSEGYHFALTLANAFGLVYHDKSTLFDLTVEGDVIVCERRADDVLDC